MKNSRRKFSKSFKTKVVLEALKERETLAALATKFELHATQISAWKQEFLKGASRAFDSKDSKEVKAVDADKLYAKIGRLEMDNEFLKKSLDKLDIR